MLKLLTYLFITLSLLVPHALAQLQQPPKKPGGIAGLLTPDEDKKPLLPLPPKPQNAEKIAPVIKSRILFDESEMGDDIIGPIDEREDSILAIENKNDEHLACTPTPSVRSIHRNVKLIRKGNNLTQKTGSPSRAIGNYIEIIGLLTDENCLPIQGAVVEVWQADRLGNYEWEYDTNSYFELPREGRDNNFMFSGTSQTDNLGQFNLMSIFPGTKSKTAPHINIIIKREGYKTLRTRMYFAKHPRNDSDHVLTNVSEEGRAALIAVGRKLPDQQREGRLYYFPVTMSGIGAYKRY